MVVASDAPAGDESAGPTPPPFNAIVTAEIVALIEDFDSKVYKLTALCKMKRALMEKQGKLCDINAI